MISRYASRKFAAFLSTSRCCARYCRSFFLLRTASQRQTRLTLAACIRFHAFPRTIVIHDFFLADSILRSLGLRGSFVRFVEKAGSIERIGRRSDREESGLVPLEIQRG